MNYDRSKLGSGNDINDLSLFTILKHKLISKGISRTQTRRRLIVSAAILGLTLGIATAIGWRIFVYQPVNVNPFSAKLTASLQFPLFHPTYVPAGYHVNVNSVTEPTTGVVVFSLDGPNKQKIYMSEEARPAKFDIGGFFAKFSDLKESAITGGTIATGKIDNGHTEVASMLNNQVWIIGNTNAAIPIDQMAQLVKGLTSNVTQ